MLNVYSASAGAGKTFNLVLDYLAICFGQEKKRFLEMHDRSAFRPGPCDTYRTILAITFTNNAGAEMKQRIVGRLDNFAFANSIADMGLPEFQNLKDKVFGNASLPDDDCFIFFKRCSQVLLRDILYDYARFSVSTIDSFIQRVIRSSALYLGLNMNYSVQIRLEEYYRSSIEQYIASLPENNLQLMTVVEELTRQLEEDGKADVRRFLKKSLDTIYQKTEKSHEFLSHNPDFDFTSKLIASWKKDLKSFYEDYKGKLPQAMAEISGDAAKIFSEATGRGLKVHGRNKWDEIFEKLATDEACWLNIKGGGYESSAFLKKKFNKDSIFNTFNDEQLKEHYSDEVAKLYDKAKNILDEYANRYYTSLILLRNSSTLLVLYSLREKMDLLKEKTNAFFLSESNPLIFDEIRSDSQGLQLFEKVSFYKHFFLDEFQDTSFMQWEDLKPLLLNALSSNGSVTLFGDVKQSIYRFRNGDVKLLFNLMDYGRLETEEKEIAHVLPESKYRQIPLDTNRRSLPNIVTFNNEFFAFYSDCVGKSNYYSEVKQKTAAGNGGAVFAFLCDKSTLPPDLTPYASEETAGFMENIYPNLKIDDSYIVYSVFDALGRGYRYGDIMILMSGNDKCSSIANILMTANIPVVTTESLNLSDNEAVSVIIATLSHCIYPADAVNQSVILKYLCEQAGRDYVEIISKTCGFAGKLSELGMDDFEDRVGEMLNNPILFAVRDIVSMFRFSEDNNPFLADFLDLVADFQHDGIANVEHFLQYWRDLVIDDKVPKLSLPEGHNAVRVMTVHKSKGLEANVVITSCKDSNGKSNNLAWIQKDGICCPVPYDKDMKYSEFGPYYEQEEDDKTLDRLNKWYVDFTRARELLYVVTTKSAKRETLNVQNILTSFVLEKFTSINDTVYLFGDATQTKKMSQKKKSDVAGLEFSLSQFSFSGRDKVRITEASDDEARSLGDEIHAVLQKLRSFPQNDDEITSFITKHSSVLAEKLRAVFRQIIAEDRLHPYFFPEKDDKVMNEAEIILPDGSTKRPDRIVFKKDHVMILDYKTGKKADDIYRKQLDTYKQQLENMGCTNVFAEIVYLKVS